MRRLTTFLVFALILAACSVDPVGGDAGSDADPPATEATEATEATDNPPVASTVDDGAEQGDAGTEPDEPDLPFPPASAPPDITLVSDTGESLALSAISYCWSEPDGMGICADGMPVEPFSVLTGTRSFVIEWPVDGWVWSVSSAGETGFCTPTQQVLGVVAGAEIEIPNGEQVSIFGRGPGGDAWFVLASDFADPVASVPLQAGLGWAPPADALPEHAHLWVTLANLGAEPEEADITASITSDGGAVDLELVTEWNPDCWNGALSAFTDPGRQPEELAGLEPPYEVTVTIRIDDRTYRAEPITWPDDFPEGTDEGPLLTLVEVGE